MNLLLSRNVKTMPHPAPKKGRPWVRAVAIVLITIVTVASLSYFNVIPRAFEILEDVIPWPFKVQEENGGEVTEGEITITFDSPVQVASQSVDQSGGVIEVVDDSSPMNGLKIEVPEGATDELITFTLSYTNIVDIEGLTENAAVVSKMFTIQTSGSESWNEYEVFNLPVMVTLPYDSSLVAEDQPVRFYSYGEQNHILESSGFFSENVENHTITFLTSKFSDFIAIKLKLRNYELLGSEFEVDTKFRPTVDGWFIENWGSYLLPKGFCRGMSLYASWYYRFKKPYTVIGLYEMYKEGDPLEWRDDATAIQLATRAHVATSEISRRVAKVYGDKIGIKAPVGGGKISFMSDAPSVAITWIHGMMVTDQPQLVHLYTIYVNNEISGGHLALTYRFKNNRFDIYDPAVAGSHPDTNALQIPFTFSEGFTRTYKGNPGNEYNFFGATTLPMWGTTNRFYQGLYNAAEKQFKDDTLFPTVKFTSPNTTPLGTTPEDTDSDGTRDTPEETVIISGTIGGGQEEVRSAYLFINAKSYRLDVVNGQFSKEVPVLQGNNTIIVFAAKDKYDEWAGWLKDFIYCNATQATITATLTWEKNNCDLDLHVLEPTIDTEPGRHIYFGNPGGGNADGISYPYLDIDNTWGLGPEHYYATEKMSLPNYPGPEKSLYGTYKFRVHYFADHDEEENTQFVFYSLEIKYLAFRIEAEGGREMVDFWKEIDELGLLEVENTEGVENFYNSDASWDEIFTVEYPQPDPEDYKILPPSQYQFPRH